MATSGVCALWNDHTPDHLTLRPLILAEHLNNARGANPLKNQHSGDLYTLSVLNAVLRLPKREVDRVDKCCVWCGQAGFAGWAAMATQKAAQT